MDRARLVEIVREASGIAVARRASITRTLKPDGSVVTEADRDVERFLRATLHAEFPSRFWGEEEGLDGEGPGVWLVDPVDGTTNFAYGSPLWGVSVAYLEAGEFPFACIHLPDIGETYSCGVEGAFLNERPLPPVPQAEILPSSPVSVSENLLVRHGFGAFFGRPRLSGAFVVDGTWTLTGRLRALFGEGERLYDVAAVIALARHVGLVDRWFDGTPIEFETLLDKRRITPWTLLPADLAGLLPLSPA